MPFVQGNSPVLTDGDVDLLAWRFLHSAYADDTYADWSLDRRLDGFLRRDGLASIAEDGDAYHLLLDRVMAYIAARDRLPESVRAPRPGGRP